MHARSVRGGRGPGPPAFCLAPLLFLRRAFVHACPPPPPNGSGGPLLQNFHATGLHTCMPACMHACRHAGSQLGRQACMVACLLACIPTCIHACRHSGRHAGIQTCMHARRHVCRHAYRIAGMHSCLGVCLHACFMHAFIQVFRRASIKFFILFIYLYQATMPIAPEYIIYSSSFVCHSSPFPVIFTPPELTHSRSLLLSWHMLAYLLTNFIAYLVYSFCSDFKIQNLFSNIQLRTDL